MSELANSLEAYQLMPFRFRRLERTPDTVLVTSEAGEHAFLDESSFNQLVNLKPLNLGIADDLDARQILCRDDRSLAVRLLATKLRTRKSFLRHGPSLHIFVVTLSCDHSCAYCQVSRRIGSAEMPEGVAVAAVERMFESPSPDLTVEFQGGEPLLAFDRISQIVRLIEARNVDGRRRIRYTLTSTLHHLDERAQALETLGAISVDSPHYFRAKSAMAQVYLKHNNDKQRNLGGACAKMANGTDIWY